MKDEDHAASNIVAGLYGSGSKTHLVASRLGVPIDDSTEFEIAKGILDSVSGGMFHPSSPNRRFIVDVRKPNRKKTCWEDADELEELCSLSEALPEGMIAVCRIEKGNDVMSASYVFVKDGPSPPAYLLRPPSALVARSGATSVWRRPTKALFKDMAEVMKWDLKEVGSEG